MEKNKNGEQNKILRHYITFLFQNCQMWFIVFENVATNIK